MKPFLSGRKNFVMRTLDVEPEPKPYDDREDEETGLGIVHIEAAVEPKEDGETPIYGGAGPPSMTSVASSSMVKLPSISRVKEEGWDDLIPKLGSDLNPRTSAPVTAPLLPSPFVSRITPSPVCPPASNWSVKSERVEDSISWSALTPKSVTPVGSGPSLPLPSITLVGHSLPSAHSSNRPVKSEVGQDARSSGSIPKAATIPVARPLPPAHPATRPVVKLEETPADPVPLAPATPHFSYLLSSPVPSNLTSNLHILHLTALPPSLSTSSQLFRLFPSHLRPSFLSIYDAVELDAQPTAVLGYFSHKVAGESFAFCRDEIEVWARDGSDQGELEWEWADVEVECRGWLWEGREGRDWEEGRLEKWEEGKGKGRMLEHRWGEGSFECF